MKKSLMFATALLASAQICFGAAIDWTLSGMNSVLKNYSGGTAANETVYLILADATSVESITELDSESAFSTALAAITVASVKSGEDGKKPSVTTATFESSKLTAGTQYTFGMLYTGKDSEGAGYYRLVTSQNKVAAYDASDPSSSQAVSLSWSTMNSASWSKGYTAVPEPSVAIMGLLGLGMLLKRRRA